MEIQVFLPDGRERTRTDAAPLPAFLITFSDAAIFGWRQGAVLSNLQAGVWRTPAPGTHILAGEEALTCRKRLLTG